MTPDDLMQISRIEVQGFRAFGSSPQVMNLEGSMALAWGPNSQGKSSLAEALEFLFTGKFSRRELLGSAVREFGNCLRNAHIKDDVSVYVSVTLADGGESYILKRELVEDYGHNYECKTRLTLDEEKLENLDSLGLRLSEPPLEAPVLLQHTLRYVVSARPKDRADYFKALLELSDLEKIRAAIASAQLPHEDPPGTEDIRKALDNIVGDDKWASLIKEYGKPDDLKEVLTLELKKLLEDEEIIVEDDATVVKKAKGLLHDRREMEFPLSKLLISEIPKVTSLDDDSWRAIEEFSDVNDKIDDETTRLAGLFSNLLEVPAVQSIEHTL